MENALRDKIRQEFQQGTLKVLSANPVTQEVSAQPVYDIMRHCVAGKTAICVTVADGASAIFTADHSLFQPTEHGGFIPVETSAVVVGSEVVVICDGVCKTQKVIDVTVVPCREYMYDLCVPGNENFMLSNGLLAHNSYSIGGINLDLERSSKYESAARMASEQFDKLVEFKHRTTKIVAGLRQPRFNTGVRSSFGPFVSRGTLSPRNYVGF